VAEARVAHRPRDLVAHAAAQAAAEVTALAHEATVPLVDGKVTDEIRIAAAKDGKTVDVTDKDMRRGQTTTYTLEKHKL